MATTVNAAFEQFLKNVVNLDPADTSNARSGRTWLFDQIHTFPQKYSDFPRLYSEMDLAFGSFARRTKIRPLDDVDVLATMMGELAFYNDFAGGVVITVPDECESNLRHYLHDGTRRLNSRRIVNAFVRAAKGIPQYSKSEISRNGEAANIKLSSYPWSFDVVPAFFTAPEVDRRTYYIIPDGKGDWKRTDPRLDRDRVSRLNSKHDGNMLNLLRCMKYWNSRKTAPAIPSYLFECMICDHCALLNDVSKFVDLGLEAALKYVGKAIWGAVGDPKGIQGDLNTLTFDARLDISVRANLDAGKASEARMLESNGDHKGSINKWCEVFGPQFPTYG